MTFLRALSNCALKGLCIVERYVMSRKVPAQAKCSCRAYSSKLGSSEQVLPFAYKRGLDESFSFKVHKGSLPSQCTSLTLTHFAYLILLVHYVDTEDMRWCLTTLECFVSTKPAHWVPKSCCNLNNKIKSPHRKKCQVGVRGVWSPLHFHFLELKRFWATFFASRTIKKPVI